MDILETFRFKIDRLGCGKDLEGSEHVFGHVEFQGPLRHPDEVYRVGN